jgi:plasmid stabilization system protein ParE
MSFEIILSEKAKEDVDKAFTYYNQKQEGLGNKFATDLNSAFQTLEKNPFFRIRYKDFRCLPLEVFPYMLHYVVNENNSEVTIYGIINTSLNPETNWFK